MTGPNGLLPKIALTAVAKRPFGKREEGVVILIVFVVCRINQNYLEAGGREIRFGIVKTMTFVKAAMLQSLEVYLLLKHVLVRHVKVNHYKILGFGITLNYSKLS